VTGSTSFPTLVEGYRVYCLAEGKSPKTIRWYLGKLRVFLVHLRENVRADEQNPLKPARDAPLAAGTIQGYARTVKAFFAWLAREEYLPKDPAQRVGIPKAPDTVVETFSEAQVPRLLGVVDRRGARGFRDYCILLVLLDTGIRLSELVHLQVGDVDFDRATCKVLGKGSRERLVPFGAKVQAALWKYLHKFRPTPFHPNVREVFLRSDGLPMAGNYVYRLVRG
jgi:site-specific recombinase XerD